MAIMFIFMVQSAALNNYIASQVSPMVGLAAVGHARQNIASVQEDGTVRLWQVKYWLDIITHATMLHVVCLTVP